MRVRRFLVAARQDLALDPLTYDGDDDAPTGRSPQRLWDPPRLGAPC